MLVGPFTLNSKPSSSLLLSFVSPTGGVTGEDSISSVLSPLDVWFGEKVPCSACTTTVELTLVYGPLDRSVERGSAEEGSVLIAVLDFQSVVFSGSFLFM